MGAAVTRAHILRADARQIPLPDNTAHAIITDPPYGLNFMGKTWDSGAVTFDPNTWTEALRVARPGAHLAAFGGTRTFHRLAVAIEDAGWETRDTIGLLGWTYGSGFPKSLDIGKAIDRAEGARRAVVGTARSNGGRTTAPGAEGQNAIGSAPPHNRTWPVTVPATDAAKHWDGWGTALKPAWEPIILARKPFPGTVANNVQTHHAGGLNIDACRIAARGTTDYNVPATPNIYADTCNVYGKWAHMSPSPSNPAGRWPPNLLLAHHPECGDTCTPHCHIAAMDGRSGGASRYYPIFRYQPKAPTAERPTITVDGRTIHHPTVKPLGLMRWLARLLAPPGGLILDPFAGSGATIQAAQLEGFDGIGLELDPHYVRLAQRRLHGRSELPVTTIDPPARDAAELPPAWQQTDLFAD